MSWRKFAFNVLALVLAYLFAVTVVGALYGLAQLSPLLAVLAVVWCVLIAARDFGDRRESGETKP